MFAWRVWGRYNFYRLRRSIGKGKLPNILESKNQFQITRGQLVSIYKLKIYLLLLFRLYFIQTVEQAASPTTKKTKPEWKYKLSY